MLEFIKMFILGIVYTILFPFIVVIFSLCLLYTLGNYLVMELIGFFGFFFGYTFSTKTDLEKKLSSMKCINSNDNYADSNKNNLESEFADFFAQDNIFEDVKGSDEHE